MNKLPEMHLPPVDPHSLELTRPVRENPEANLGENTVCQTLSKKLGALAACVCQCSCFAAPPEQAPAVVYKATNPLTEIPTSKIEHLAEEIFQPPLAQIEEALLED